MNNKCLDKNISYLSINNDIIEILNKNNLIRIRDVWVLKRKDLKNIGLSDHQISNIIIKLQLNGLDLNGKIYNKL